MMKANEFIRTVGLDKSYLVLAGNEGARYFGCKIETAKYWLSGSNEYHIQELFFPNMSNQFALNLDDLKRLIISHERVMEHGSISRAKEYAESDYTAPEIREMLLKAIADVESCQ